MKKGLGHNREQITESDGKKKECRGCSAAGLGFALTCFEHEKTLLLLLHLNPSIKMDFFSTSVKSLLERQWKGNAQVYAVSHTQIELLATVDGQKSQPQILTQAPNVFLGNTESFLAQLVVSAAQSGSVCIKALNSYGYFALYFRHNKQTVLHFSPASLGFLHIVQPFMRGCSRGSGSISRHFLAISKHRCALK